MTTQRNFLSELNTLNVNLGVKKSVSKKYDYENLNIPKKLRYQFRKDVRKQTESVYSNFENLNVADIKKFAEFQQNALLACTTTKKKFTQLQVSEVYPNFESLNKTEKESIQTAHKKIIEKIK